MNLSAIQTALAREFNRVSGVQVIWRNQDGERPARPFVDLNISTLEAENESLEEFETVALTPETVATPRLQRIIATLEVIVYSDKTVGDVSAFNIARRLSMGLAQIESVDLLDLTSISLVDFEAVRDLSVVWQTEFEGRASFSLRLRALDIAAPPTSWIETVVVNTPE